MRRRFRKTSIRLVAVIAVALVSAGGALAYYSASGSGSGSASVGSPAALTIAAITPTDGLLYPGSTGEVDAAISNPNPFVVRVNSLVLGSGGIAADSAHSGCDTSSVHYAAQSNGGLGWQVPPRVGSTDGTLTVRLPGAIDMDRSAANECQGAVFTVSLVTGP